jgi:hypothetical protein
MKPNKSQFDEAPEWWATPMTSDAMASMTGPEDAEEAPDKDTPEASEWLDKATEKNPPPF